MSQNSIFTVSVGRETKIDLPVSRIKAQHDRRRRRQALLEAKRKSRPSEAYNPR